jgi:hypothetical protein
LATGQEGSSRPFDIPVVQRAPDGISHVHEAKAAERCAFSAHMSIAANDSPGHRSDTSQ